MCGRSARAAGGARSFVRCRIRRRARESATVMHRAPRSRGAPEWYEGSAFAFLTHRNSHAFAFGGGNRRRISGIGMARHADARVTRQDALEPLVGVGRAVGDD